MKSKIFYTLSILFLIGLTGCYTQVATQESPDHTQYNEPPNSESSGYYYEEDSDSGYYVEDDEGAIINNYYYDDYYPSYRRYYGYYYPAFTIGIGFGYYYPYFWNSWCGYSWYDPYPYYWYYPSYYSCYYSYYPYNYYPGGYYGYSYYDDDYYKTRSDYTSRLRNNSGGRGSGNRLREPVSTSLTNYTTNRQRDFSGNGRDLTLSSSVGLVTRDLTDKNSSTSINNVKRNGTDKLSSTKIGRTDQLGMIDRDLATDRTDKQLSGTNVIKNNNRKNYLGNNTTDKMPRTIGTQKTSKSIQNSGRITGKTGNTYNLPRKDYSNDKRNTTPKNNTTTTKRNSNQPKQYSTPKNNNSPKNYSPPTRTNTNNSPRSYSPPSGNNSPRTTSPPRNSGNTSRSSGNNGSRR